jgi:hypothetical protein
MVAAFYWAEAPGAPIGLEVVSEDVAEVGAGRRNSPRLDSLRRTEPGGLLLFASYGREPSRVGLVMEVDENGDVAAETTEAGSDTLLCFGAIGEGSEQWMIERTVRGDTLWSRRLEGTVGFYIGMGCRLPSSSDPRLYVERPEDIHPYLGPSRRAEAMATDAGGGAFPRY